MVNKKIDNNQSSVIPHPYKNKKSLLRDFLFLIQTDIHRINIHNIIGMVCFVAPLA
jgi:hypothetical protein